jgi:hypothetical protein
MPLEIIHLRDVDGAAACGTACDDAYLTPNDSMVVMTCTDCRLLAAVVRAARRAALFGIALDPMPAGDTTTNAGRLMLARRARLLVRP